MMHLCIAQCTYWTPLPWTPLPLSTRSLPRIAYQDFLPRIKMLLFGRIGVGSASDRGVHPPEAMMHFPLFQISPYFRKFFRLHGNLFQFYLFPSTMKICSHIFF